MAEYTVLYEQGETNWGAIVPDLPGCVSLGDTLEDVQSNVREAIAVYIEVLKEQGQPVPPPRYVAGAVTVSLQP